MALRKQSDEGDETRTTDEGGDPEIDVERRSEPEADNQVAATNGSEEATDEGDETRTTDEGGDAEIDDVERRSELEADNQVAATNGSEEATDEGDETRTTDEGGVAEIRCGKKKRTRSRQSSNSLEWL